MDRETNEIITKEPNKIAELLLGKGATAQDLSQLKPSMQELKIEQTTTN